jgi:hypothetical protein
MSCEQVRYSGRPRACRLMVCLCPRATLSLARKTWFLVKVLGMLAQPKKRCALCRQHLDYSDRSNHPTCPRDSYNNRCPRSNGFRRISANCTCLGAAQVDQRQVGSPATDCLLALTRVQLGLPPHCTPLCPASSASEQGVQSPTRLHHGRRPREGSAQAG